MYEIRLCPECAIANSSEAGRSYLANSSKLENTKYSRLTQAFSPLLITTDEAEPGGVNTMININLK